MGSGLVYAAVGLVWAWYAASRVAGARAERRADQESSAQARVIRRAVVTDPLDGTGGTGPAPTDGRPAASSTAASSTAGPAVVPPATRGVSPAARRAAVRRRRTVLALLVLASLGLGASVALGYLPIWAAAPAPVLCLAHLVAGARASRRSAARSVPAVRALVPATTDDPSWAGVPFVDVVADWCRTDPGDAHVEAGTGGATQTEADRVEAARLRSASTPAVDAAGVTAGSWRAVPVPLPTYVTAPRVARTVKTIDLGSTGSWTSGRSAPSPIALPVVAIDPAAGASDPDADVVPSPSAGASETGSEQDATEDTEALELPQAATA